MDNKVKDAIQVLVEALKTDEGYRIGWKANIAMAFKDEIEISCMKSTNNNDYYVLIPRDQLHKILNTAADNFLKMLCN